MQSLLDAKKEYTDIILDNFSIPICSFIYDIYKSCKNIQEFQNKVAYIKNWNNNTIRETYINIVNSSKCKLLQKILKEVIIINIKLKTTSVNIKSLKIISSEDFIHKCLINTGLYCWKNAYLFSHKNLKPCEKQYHLNIIEKNIRKIIKTTIRDCTPYEIILNDNNNESDDIEEPVKEVIKPEEAEEDVESDEEEEDDESEEEEDDENGEDSDTIENEEDNKKENNHENNDETKNETEDKSNKNAILAKESIIEEVKEIEEVKAVDINSDNNDEEDDDDEEDDEDNDSDEDEDNDSDDDEEDNKKEDNKKPDKKKQIIYQSSSSDDETSYTNNDIKTIKINTNNTTTVASKKRYYS